MLKIVENRKINDILNRAISRFPELRFNQILHGLSIVANDESTFYDEPGDILERIKRSELYGKLNDTFSNNGVF